MKQVSLLIASMALAGCMATGDGGNNHSYTKVNRTMPKVQFSDATTVEEIRALKPQATVPLNVAVLMPKGGWSPAPQERAIVQQWGEKLTKLGFIRRLDIIPNTMRPICGYKAENNCYLNQARAAAARFNADAILMLSVDTETRSYANFFSIFNWTIVGMWVVPGHHRDAYSVYQATLFDINNGYLYAHAAGEAEHKLTRPLVYAEKSVSIQNSREKALQNVGEQLFLMADAYMSQVPK